MRYRISKLNEVLDTKTNLIWRKDAEPLRYTSEEALAIANKVAKETGIEWRLPTIEELTGLIDYTLAMPASTFPGMNNDSFWSSTKYKRMTDALWVANLCTGNILYYSLPDQIAGVRLVRNMDK